MGITIPDLHNKQIYEPLLGFGQKINSDIAVRAGVRTGKAGQLPRGLHNQGAFTYVLSPFICLVF